MIQAKLAEKRLKDDENRILNLRLLLAQCRANQKQLSDMISLIVQYPQLQQLFHLKEWQLYDLECALENSEAKLQNLNDAFDLKSDAHAKITNQIQIIEKELACMRDQLFQTNALKMKILEEVAEGKSTLKDLRAEIQKEKEEKEEQERAEKETKEQVKAEKALFDRLFEGDSDEDEYFEPTQQIQQLSTTSRPRGIVNQPHKKPSRRVCRSFLIIFL